MNKTEKVRILFITHTPDMVSGASRSLKNLIANFDEKVDMIIPKSVFVSNKELKDFYGFNVDRIYRYNLPFRGSISAWEKKADWFDQYQTDANFRSNKKEIYRIISENKYDVIHVNSYVLYPLISEKYPMYIHVREICTANVLAKIYIKAQFRRSHGIIYIDYASREALGVTKGSIVLNNPFNQEKVLEVDSQKVRNKYLLKEKNTIFVYISASNDPSKGLSFVLEAFVKANCKEARLLIVGPPKIPKYAKYNNIQFVGKITRMEEIYAVSDYVLRGDNIFAVGRTVYEGLYSGCSVIIPGNQETDMQKMFEGDKFKDRIYFYKLRDMGSLVKIIRERNGKKKEAVLGLSNIDEYVKQFKKFVFGSKGIS